MRKVNPTRRPAAARRRNAPGTSRTGTGADIGQAGGPREGAHLSPHLATASRQLDLFPEVAHTTPADLRLAAQLRLQELWTRCPTGMPRRGELPHLVFFRGRSDAGRAILRSGQVEVNEDLLERHPAPMLEETIAHELAHVLVWRLHGRRARPHGAEWQAVMRDWFGVEPERTHHFALDGLAVRRQQRFPYRCDCRDHALSSVRHRRARTGVDYRCLACQGRLRCVSSSPLPADTPD